MTILQPECSRSQTGSRRWRVPAAHVPLACRQAAWYAHLAMSISTTRCTMMPKAVPSARSAHILAADCRRQRHPTHLQTILGLSALPNTTPTAMWKVLPHDCLSEGNAKLLCSLFNIIAVNVRIFYNLAVEGNKVYVYLNTSVAFLFGVSSAHILNAFQLHFYQP